MANKKTKFVKIKPEDIKGNYDYKGCECVRELEGWTEIIYHKPECTNIFATEPNVPSPECYGECGKAWNPDHMPTPKQECKCVITDTNYGQKVELCKIHINKATCLLSNSQEELPREIEYKEMQNGEWVEEPIISTINQLIRYLKAKECDCSIPGIHSCCPVHGKAKGVSKETSDFPTDLTEKGTYYDDIKSEVLTLAQKEIEKDYKIWSTRTGTEDLDYIHAYNAGLMDAYKILENLKEGKE